MAAKIAARYVARRLSSGGKVLSEEEKAAENVFIKAVPLGTVCMIQSCAQYLSLSTSSLLLYMLDVLKHEKIEKEKLEKLAQKGPKPAEEAPVKPEPSSTEVKSTATQGSSTAGTSTDPIRNYAVLAGTAAAVCGLGWYLLSKPSKTEEVVD
ncbi:hypothetical protein ZIOFF_073352 [Zingiber officinale]|uniref:Uncharacterized protein n=1 Tax=Zingiber officinale TaxID=94328 RepID=A0A8J5C958_ZINOF|nr:hypothetical protein ZIOFF_073352 [Zingiber officinale]